MNIMLRMEYSSGGKSTQLSDLSENYSIDFELCTLVKFTSNKRKGSPRTRLVPSDCPRANEGSERLSPKCWRVTRLSLPSFSSSVKTRLVEKLKAPFFNGRQEARVMVKPRSSANA